LNYLGHLYFSGDDYSLMLANLYGDFVKGKDYSYLPKIVQEGVLLHRNIDDYVDHHPHVTSLRLKLFKDLPKIAGIAIDLYFDHLLAKQWSQYHNQNLFEYIDCFFEYALNDTNLCFKENKFKYPDSFVNLLKVIHKHDFMKQYISLDGVKMASKGLSKRISFDNNLGQASEVFLVYEKEINAAFDEYMLDAKHNFRI